MKSLYFAVFGGGLSGFLRSDIVPTQVTTTLFTDYTTSWIANDGGIPNPQQERKPFAQDEGRTVISLNGQPSLPGWKLVWEENFDKDGVIDEAVWSKIPRGRPDWQRNMSDYKALYDVKDNYKSIIYKIIYR